MKAIVISVLVVCFSVYAFVWFNDSNVPELIEEQVKVKAIDASMRFYANVISLLVSLGVTQPFSPLDRYVADLSLLAQTTGVPWWSYNGPDLRISNREMNGVPVRIYEPKSTLNQRQRPVVIYIHGGGWTMLSVDSYEPFTSRMAVEADVVVISVNYRQSPQFPFPIPRQDSMAVVKFVLQNARDLGIDASRIAIGGDSCGGNLAASLALELKKSVSLQILIVPALQPINTLSPSAIENGFYMSNSINDRHMYSAYLLYGGISLEAYPFLINNSHFSSDAQNRLQASILNVKDLVPSDIIRTPELRSKGQLNSQGKTNQVVSQEAVDRRPWAKKMSKVFMDPHFAPLLADDEILRQSPRTYVMTAGYDIIRDDGVMYHHRLQKLGVPGVWKNYPEAFHHACLFHSGPMKLKVGELILNDVVDYIRLHL